VAGMADVPGSAGWEMTAGVAYLDPGPAVFEAMLAGWERQQRTRFLSDGGRWGRGWRWCGGWPGSRASTRGSGSRPTARRSSAICGRRGGGSSSVQCPVAPLRRGLSRVGPA
jgi:hypothetical protein